MVQISSETKEVLCAEKQWRKIFKQEESAIKAMKLYGKAALENGVGIGALVSLKVGGPELEFSSSVTFFPIFGLTAVLKILSFPALVLGDNIAD